jgi:hypothetical protein
MRDIPHTSTLQDCVDHILEHGEELPPLASSPARSSSASDTPTSVISPASNDMYYIPPSGPPPAHSMRSSVFAAPTESSPAAPFTAQNVNSPSNHANTTFATSRDPRSDLERFEAILAEEQTMRESLYDDIKDIGIKVYKMMREFFDEELSKRRVEYGLSLADVGEIPVLPPTNQSNNPFVTLVDSERVPPLPPRRHPDPPSTLGSASTTLTLPMTVPNVSTPPTTQPPSNSAVAQDPIISGVDPGAVNYPNQKFIPPSTELANILSSVTDHFESSPVIQEARSAINTLHSEMEGKVSGLRFGQSSTGKSSIFAPGGSEQQRRAEEHSQKISHLYSTNQYEAATRLEKEYQDHEKQLILENKERELYQWKRQFWSPARDHLFAELEKAFAEYAILEGLLKTEAGTAPGQVPRIRLDVLETVRALEQVADLRDRVGYEGLDNLENEIRQKEYELKVQAALDGAERAGSWGTSEFVSRTGCP